MNAFPALIAPVRQIVWGIPAVINLCAGGTGSVLYGLTFLLPDNGGSPLGLSQVNFIRLFCVLMIAAGFAAVGIESRKPMNARFLLHHLRRSWMSLEVLAGVLFIILAFLDIISPHKMIRFGALAMGMLLLVSQVMMVYDARGVQAWNTGLVTMHALSLNFYLACGVGLIFCSFGDPFDPWAIIMAALVSLVVNHMAWWTLLRSQKAFDLSVALKPLNTRMKLTISIGIGHILPALTLGFGIGLEVMLKGSSILKAILVLTGALIVIGGTAQKAGIILGANSLKAIKPGPVREGRNFHG